MGDCDQDHSVQECSSIIASREPFRWEFSSLEDLEDRRSQKEIPLAAAYLAELPLKFSSRRRIPVLEQHPVPERADRIDGRIPRSRLVGCVTRKHVFIFFPGVISRGELGIDGW